ncbi:hypothetical protein [Thermococcus sp. GR6]|uniref:hypothetical protein n=1 Tax=Thermococcus sp. GR6 TaxID=1638256 RepID=UPI00143078B7|nr:hypothetical protein [Thermococcus sp. GR6]
MEIMENSPGWGIEILKYLDKISNGRALPLILALDILALIVSGALALENVISFKYMLLFMLIILGVSLYFVMIEKTVIIEENKTKRKELSVKDRELDIKYQLMEFSKIKFSDNIKRFFEVLEKHGIQTLKEIEAEITSQITRAVIVMESGEGILSRESTEQYKRNVSQVLTSYLQKRHNLDKGPTSFFKLFFDLKIRPQIQKVYRVDITGVSSFVVFLDKNKDIITFGEEIIREYKNFVNEQVSTFQNSSEYKRLGTYEKQYLQQWARSFNPPYHPKIIISVPYQSDLINFPQIFPEEERERFEREIRDVIHQKLEVSPIKISYLFEASGFENLPVLLGEIEKKDRCIKQKISGNPSLYIKDLLARSDPYTDIMTALEQCVPSEIYDKINQYPSHLKRLQELIRDLAELLA